MRYLPIVLTFAATALAQSPNFVGARGCNASNCHGYDTERKYSPETRIYGNEYTTWRGSDKHRDAAKVLQDTRGKRMAAILNISDATKDKRCAVCHVVGSPEDQRMDGVSCEACHGPAAQWRDSHRAANSHKDSVSKGMTDTKNPLELTKLCMSCHVGSGDRIVDHEMIAAGHPDLAFEIDTFEAAEPSHHRPDPAGTQAENKKRLQNWAIGQANAMATGMSLMATHERSWPEFSDLECYQCHHDLRRDSWRIAQGFAGRKAGTLRVNLARYEVLRVLVATAAQDKRQAFESAFTRLSDSVSQNLSNGAAMAQSARALAQIAGDLTTSLGNANIDPKAIVGALNANIDRISQAGVNAAEQATMTLDAMTNMMGQPTSTVKPLYDYLEHPSTYTPAGFVTLFKRAAGGA